MAPFWEVASSGFLPAGRADGDLGRVGQSDVEAERPREAREALEGFAALGPHLHAYRALPELVREGGLALREHLAALPRVDVVTSYEAQYDAHCLLLDNAADRESAFSLFGILASAYVHATSEEILGAVDGDGEQSLPVILPACLAVPFKVLAAEVGRLPILDYAGVVLSNWELVNEAKELSLGNVRILRSFTRLPAEEWFYKVHVVIEFHGASAMRAIEGVRAATAGRDWLDEDRNVLRVLQHANTLLRAVRSMNGVLGRMKEGCNEADFFNLIRPWLSGWKPPGVVYASYDAKDFEPEPYSGGSGAQSSIMPCLDAFLGVRHGNATVDATDLAANLAKVGVGVSDLDDANLGAGAQSDARPDGKSATSTTGARSAASTATRAVHSATSATSTNAKAPVSFFLAAPPSSSSAAAEASSSTASKVAGAAEAAGAAGAAEAAEAAEAAATAARKMAAREAFVQSLRRYRAYMPPAHVLHIALLERSRGFRDVVADLEACHTALAKKATSEDLPISSCEHYHREASHKAGHLNRLKLVYNSIVELVVSFRRKHVGFAISYITSQARARARKLVAAGGPGGHGAAVGSAILKKSEKGTGGSDFKAHLMQHIKDSSYALFDVPASALGESRAPFSPLPRVLPGVGQFMPPSSIFAMRTEPEPLPLTAQASLEAMSPRGTPTSRFTPPR